MKLRISLEIDVSEMTMLDMAAMVDRVRAAIDMGGRKRVVQMRLPSAMTHGPGGIVNPRHNPQGRAGI
jgi:hypothetical protein